MDPLARHDVVGIRAGNPGIFSLSGTNTWIVGRDPAWVVDPGPSLPAHLDALAAELAARGGLGGIALTHDHPDHAEAVPALRERLGPAPVAAARGEVELQLEDGGRAGPLVAVATPGHASDHLAYVLAGSAIAFSGDAVLGEGSVFVAPDAGALAAYLAGLARLRALELELICPGHGPLVEDPAAKLAEYVAHRLERERRLLDAAWADAPAALRPAAAITLAAHLDKLADEGRLPAGVERPRGWPPS